MYRKSRNFFTEELNKAKTAYFKRQRSEFDDAKSGSSWWWRLAKRLSRIAEDKSLVPVLEADGIKGVTDQQKLISW